MPLRIPGKPITPSTTSNSAPAGTGSDPGPTRVAVSAPLTASFAWFRGPYVLAKNILSSPNTVKVTAVDFMNAFVVVKQLLDGSLLETHEGRPPRLPSDVPMLPHLRGVLYVRGLIRQLADETCAAAPSRLNVHYLVAATTMVRRFKDYDFSTYVLDNAIFSRYNEQIREHSKHRFGDCQCASFSERYFHEDMAAQKELRAMWNIRVVGPLKLSLECCVKSILAQMWAGETGDLPLLISLLDMAKKVDAFEWLTECVSVFWKVQLEEIGKQLQQSADKNAAAIFARTTTGDVKLRLIDTLPFPELQLKLLGLTSSVLVLSRTSWWLAELGTWLRDGRYDSSRALWELRNFTCQAGSTGDWFLKGCQAAGRDFMASLVAAFKSTELKADAFYKDVLSNFEMSTATWTTNSCGGNKAVLDAVRSAGYTALFNAVDSDNHATLCAMVLHAAAQKKDVTVRDEMVDCVVSCMRHMDSHDTCHSKLKDLLERRLLHGLSAELTAEDEIVQRLAEFDSKGAQDLASLMVDARRSTELSTRYCDNGQAGQPAFTVLVCTKSRWTVPKAIPLNVSVPVLQDQLRRFTQRYAHDRDNARKVLSWCHSYSTARVSLLYVKSQHSLLVPLVAAFILSVFDQQNTDSIASNTISSQLGALNDLSAAQTVNACLNLLVKAEVLRMNEAHVVTIARDFKPKTKLRETNLLPKNGIRIITGRTDGKGADAAAAGGAENVSEAVSVLAKERVAVLECAVVRVMKSNKTMSHNDLVSAVVATLKGKFTPTPAQLKKCIEALIDKDYLERSPEDHSVYLYHA